MEIRGCVALVTGANRGLGRAFVEALGQRGAVGVWAAARRMTLRSILLDSAIHGKIPQNAGLTRPITIVAPRGTLVNPIFPAPTIARCCPGIQMACTMMKALAEAVPTQVSAGVGNLEVIAFSGLRGETHWVHMEIHEGSYGGRYGKDGMDAVDILFTNTRNNPIEDLESHLPLRVHQYELRYDACAPGKWRGGVGSIREAEWLEDGGFSVEGEGHEHPPWGFDGGADGYHAALTLKRANGDVVELPSKIPPSTRRCRRSYHPGRTVRRRLRKPNRARTEVGS